MSVKITGEITLDEVLPLIDRLSDVEREELRQFLEAKPKIDWKKEWEKVITYFQTVFKKYPEEEIEADLEKALKEVHRARKS